MPVLVIHLIKSKKQIYVRIEFSFLFEHLPRLVFKLRGHCMLTFSVLLSKAIFSRHPIHCLISISFCDIDQAVCDDCFNLVDDKKFDAKEESEEADVIPTLVPLLPHEVIQCFCHLTIYKKLHI